MASTTHIPTTMLRWQEERYGLANCLRWGERLRRLEVPPGRDGAIVWKASEMPGPRDVVMRIDSNLRAAASKIWHQENHA